MGWYETGSDGLNIVNTRAMSLAPAARDTVALLDAPDGYKPGVRLAITGEAFRRVVDYPVVVELWDKKKESGRCRRAWEAAFTQAERNTISRYYARFYRWHLVSGTPKHVVCRWRTLLLLHRAVRFFATL